MRILLLNKIHLIISLGRPKENTHKKDFSDTDFKMAINAGIIFQTPEKFFLDSTAKLHNHIELKDSFRLCDAVSSTMTFIFSYLSTDF